METTEITIFPYLLGMGFVIALVIFLSMLNPVTNALGINPGSSAIALLTSFAF